MDITKENIKQVLPQLLQDIKSCDIISIDCEFGGISTHHEHKATDFDGLEDLYQKMKHTAINYCLLQLGLCTLTWDSEQHKYIAKCYNIYLNQDYKCDKKYLHTQLFQTECFNFLARNSLDFQKIYGQGVHFRKLSDKDSILKEIQLEIEQNNKKSSYGDFKANNQTFFSKKNQAIVDEIIEKIKIFQKDLEKKELEILFPSTYLYEKLYNGSTLNEIGEISGVVYEKSKNANSIIVKRMKQKQDIEIKEQVESEVQEVDIDDHIGVSVIFEEIIKNPKPVIGHHFCLDLFFIYENFIAPLPETYLEFTEKVNQQFPFIYDVKIIATETKAKLKKLHVYVEGLFRHVVESEKILKPYHNSCLFDGEEFQKYTDTSTTFHEAGFDAYATGVSFVALLNYRKYQSILEKAEKEFFEKEEVEYQKKLEAYEQKKAENEKNEIFDKKLKKPQKKQLTSKNNKSPLSADIQKQLLASLLQENINFQNMNNTNNNSDECQIEQYRNHIYTRIGDIEMNYEVLKKDQSGLQNNQDYINNCIQIWIKDNGVYNLQEIGEFFSQYGDAQIMICNNKVGYVQFDNFDTEYQQIIDSKFIKDLQSQQGYDTLSQKYEFNSYTERRRFKAYQMK